LSPFRFDVHGFTEDCQQDEEGIKEAAQLRKCRNSATRMLEKNAGQNTGIYMSVELPTCLD